MAEHKVLTDPELHEPKGASTALSGQVYIANGLGSGAWGSIPGFPSKIVYVDTISQLPAPILGVRYLANNTAYHIVGNITTSDPIAFGTNSMLVGDSPTQASLTYSGTGTFLTATGVNMIISGVGLVCSSTGTMFSFVDSSSTKVMAIQNSYLTSSGAGSLGTVNEAYVVSMSQTLVSGWGTALTFTGDIGRIVISGCSFENNVNIFNLAAALILGDGSISHTKFGTSGGDVVLTDGGATFTGRFIVTGCYLSGAGSFGSGFETDIDYHLDANTGFVNTNTAAQGYITGSALNTTFSATGAGNEVVINFGTAFVAAVQHQFSVSNAGVFTYLGRDTKDFFVDCPLYAEQSGGADRTYAFYIAKNSSVIASSVQKREFSSATPGALSVSTVVQLATGDTIKVYVMAITATTSLNVETASIKIIAQ